jgi:peptidoglycan hydrolase-like protein with peptidoglycan-binding domain
MVTSNDKVVETRRFLVCPTQWYEIAKKCIAENKFLIVTVCIGRDDKLEYYPTVYQWQNIIEDTIVKVQGLGGNIYNWRLDLVNEPMKYCSREQYTDLINIAYAQARGRVKIGAGCEEFIMAQAHGDMYPYICSHAKFDTLVIHIQGSCQTEADTSKWTNYALNLANTYKLSIDCNEANMFDIATSSGYDKLKMNLKYAEKIGCSNFCVVFHNLDRSAFSQDTTKWDFLCFKINNMLHSNYWEDWKSIINDKAPIPNIYIPPEEDMILDKFYKLGSKGIGVKFIQKILNEDIKPVPLLVEDGIWGSKTADIVKQYQTKYGLAIDGIVGPQSMKSMIEEYPWIWNEINYEWAIGVR